MEANDLTRCNRLDEAHPKMRGCSRTAVGALIVVPLESGRVVLAQVIGQFPNEREAELEARRIADANKGK